MKYKAILPIILSALLLCGCNAKKEEAASETATETVTDTTFNEYILTRGWDGQELLESIFYCGEYHPLPLDTEACPDFTLSDSVLYFPDNSFAEVETDENGIITAMKFSASTAPSDFSVYGISFNSRPSDIPTYVGFANYVSGDEDTKIIYTFEGGGITRLVFEFTERKLTMVYISA